MSTPDLSNRPEWANYWAQDEDGVVCWYENLPHLYEADRGQGAWIASGKGQWKRDGKMCVDAMGWPYSLVKIEGTGITVVRERKGD
jgi:hypothetical protein